MLTTLRKIGNSKGVIIPAALLSACDFADTVELRLEGRRLVIEPVKAPRRDWFEGYDAAPPWPGSRLPGRDDGSSVITTTGFATAMIARWSAWRC
jgi:antitoxin MazE